MIITNQNKGTYHKEPMRTGRKKRRLPEARENAVLVLTLIGWKKGASFFDQSHYEAKQNLSNPELYSTLDSKLLEMFLY